MAGHLRVDPIDLHVAAASIENHAVDLLAAHRSSEAQAEAASAQWIGNSADALRSLVPSWREFTSSVDTRLGKNAAHFVGAAREYSATDDGNAASIKGQGATPRLNIAD